MLPVPLGQTRPGDFSHPALVPWVIWGLADEHPQAGEVCSQSRGKLPQPWLPRPGRGQPGSLTDQGLESLGSQSGVRWKTAPPRAPGSRPAGPSAAPDTQHEGPKSSPAGTPDRASRSDGRLMEAPPPLHASRPASFPKPTSLHRRPWL